MRKITLLLIFLGSLGQLWAQQAPTLTNASFPTAGEVQEFSNDLDASISITPAGPNQTWNYSALNSDAIRYDTIKAASSGMAFANYPNTELLFPLLNGFVETYADVSTTQVVTVAGAVDFLGTMLDAPFVDSRIVQVAPLNYQDILSDASQFGIAIAVADYPALDTLIQNAGLPISPDSLRFSFRSQRSMEVDAWGDVIIGDSSYTVLRQRVDEEIGITIEGYVAFGTFGTWADVTSLVLGLSPVPVPASDTLFYYDFLAEGYSQPIARVNMNPEDTTINNVDFRGQNVGTSISSVRVNLPTWRAFPNPAPEYCSWELPAEAEVDHIQVFDMLGRPLGRRSVNGQSLFRLATDDWQPGWYVVRFYDAQHRPLAQSRIQR